MGASMRQSLTSKCHRVEPSNKQSGEVWSPNIRVLSQIAPQSSQPIQKPPDVQIEAIHLFGP